MYYLNFHRLVLSFEQAVSLQSARKTLLELSKMLEKVKSTLFFFGHSLFCHRDCKHHGLFSLCPYYIYMFILCTQRKHTAFTLHFQGRAELDKAHALKLRRMKSPYAQTYRHESIGSLETTDEDGRCMFSNIYILQFNASLGLTGKKTRFFVYYYKASTD